MITRRKRSILEMAVATACFGAAAVAAAMPVTAVAAPQSTSAQSTTQHKKAKKKQVANANLLHEVVVNGFISSIQNAIAIQKNANSIVEAVSAEQIGKLPGTSIANALSNLPGLATQMVNGRPQVLTIHGLGPDFNTVQIDGVEQASTANNRDVQLDQYPSSWFKTVEVHMSPSADLLGQGMAGTVNMITMKPLDQKGPMANLNAYYTWLEPNQVMPGPGVSDSGHDINGIFSDQFFDHTFGINVGIDLNATPSHILHQAPWGYPTDSNGNYVIGGSKNYNISDLMKREGYLLTFEYRPSSDFTSTLNMTYDDFHETQQAKGMEFPLFWSSASLASVGQVVNGFDKSGQYTGVYPVIRNDYNHTKARVYNINWNNEFRLPDEWTGTVDASYNRAMRRDIFLENYSGFGYNGPANSSTVPPTTVNFFESGNGELILNSSHNFASNSIVLTDPQGWGSGANLVQQGFINAPHTDDYLANLKVAAEHYFNSGPISSVEIGVDRRKRHKLYDITQDFIVLPGASCGVVITSTCTPTQTAAIPAYAREGSVDALGFMGIGPQVMYNPFALLSRGVDVLYPTALSSISVPPNWTVTENDTDAYFQFNIHTNLTSDIGLRGNVGLQVAHTSQVSGGARVAPGSTTGGSAKTLLIPVVGGVSYTRYLPSLNLVFSLPGDNNVRLGVARTMARPRMDYTSSSLDVSGNITQLRNTNPNQSYFSGSGGNPKLLPTMATNYNLSLEHYFTGRASGFNCNEGESKSSSLCTTGGTGYVQLSGYYMQLSDYINPNAAVLYNFKQFVPDYLTPAEQAQLGTTYGTVTAPDNGGSGHIEGLQLATNIPLGDLTPYLNGLGILASANRTISAVYYPGNSQPVTVEGLSKWVENFTVYYQRGGFQARVADDIRTSFLGRVFGISATRIEQTVAGEAWVSAQVSYSFDSGMLKGLTLIANGSNLTNQGMQTYQNNDPRQVVTWERYGRTYQLGFSYNFH